MSFRTHAKHDTYNGGESLADGTDDKGEPWAHLGGLLCQKHQTLDAFKYAVGNGRVDSEHKARPQTEP